jgi:hypothetical protein
MRADSVACFEAIVVGFSSAFTAPTAGVFLTLVRGWVQCLGRRSVAARGVHGRRGAAGLCYRNQGPYSTPVLC